MLKRAATLIMVLLFAGQAMAGGIVCGIDAISKNFNHTDEVACMMMMQSEGECGVMACCMLGKSPTGAIGAMICCEVKCGESTGGAQFNFVQLTLAPAPSFTFVRLVSLDALSDAEAALAAVSLRSADNNFLHHPPPDLFLQNSAFLI
jgi:hypothetical protein